ncbi:metal ABC transporter solute-binding protein, Zn/Mn family [Actinokineospora bangkokensis]|uniref:Metal ABC transporter substrate-binding protein n=1 Tax=Actinokineospora bangkokensis TaxID=1193682 RepID=A0A1Q9LCP0_9PSEU|nr:zinc ABC transporter substrate-binding protein [Actinokineospora bangkokensis]OLR89775.1 metal ABC transporter substrate-binding protein [Actinokineospora bangkokensis]
MRRPSPRSATTALGLAAVTLASVTACGGSQGSAAADGPVVVVASTNVWASVAQAVGGDAITVNALLSDPGADPHGYEAKPADATKFTDAKVVISNGGGYDDFVDGLADNAKDARRIVAFDLSGKGGDHDHGESAAASSGEAGHAEDGHGHDHAVNEHVWYDFATVGKVADELATDLGELVPARKDEFATKAATFRDGLTQLTTKAEAIGKAKPGAKVLATEPVAGYLLETAGLTDATPEEFSEAIEEETDPPAAAVAEVNTLVGSKQVAAVVYNGQTETPVTKQLKEKAAAAGVPVVAVTETLPEGATGYLDWMTKQVDSLAGAVSGT